MIYYLTGGMKDCNASIHGIKYINPMAMRAIFVAKSTNLSTDVFIVIYSLPS